MSESFWIIPDESAAPRTPVSIMKEQAAALAETTGARLMGSVETSRTLSGELLLTLKIVVPALDSYTFTLAQYVQPATMYPGRLYSTSLDKSFDVRDQNDFEASLRQLLESEATQRIVSSLLVQARDVA